MENILNLQRQQLTMSPFSGRARHCPSSLPLSLSHSGHFSLRTTAAAAAAAAAHGAEGSPCSPSAASSSAPFYPSASRRRHKKSPGSVAAAAAACAAFNALHTWSITAGTKKRKKRKPGQYVSLLGEDGGSKPQKTRTTRTILSSSYPQAQCHGFRRSVSPLSLAARPLMCPSAQ